MDATKTQRPDINRSIDPDAAAKITYDVVIIGSGIAGSILAKELTSNPKRPVRVLIVEAAVGGAISETGFQHYLETFYAAPSKDNNSPFARNPNAEMPRGPDVTRLNPSKPNSKAYWVQKGPLVSDSVYTRAHGGTTMHWEGKTIRMLPEDFRLKSNFKVGLDWPLDLDDLKPFYDRAEEEIGVSGNAEAQRAIGVEFTNKNYVYPMYEMPPSYLDQVVAEGLKGMTVNLHGQDYPLSLTTFPQGRNGIPNAKYGPFNPVKRGALHKPRGMVTLHQSDNGQRCQGNTNCVPLCPVQAKYDARKTLADAMATGRIDFLPQAVASQVHTDSSGKVTKIDLKCYRKPSSPEAKTIQVRGQVFVLAANAVENVRLLRASEEMGSFKCHTLTGCNLMDHPFLLAWGLLPKVAGVGRGPVVTSGICNLRGGDFRRHQAAFAVDIHNDGWGWATGSPISDLVNAVDNLNKFGKDLRTELVQQISRQLLLAFMVEMLPEKKNTVTVDPRYCDALGNMKPVISYQLPEYSLKGIAQARRLSRQLFQRLGAEDYTAFSPEDPTYLTFEGEGYTVRGGNHLAGTHIMGADDDGNSVVDSYQKSWNHRNLYLVGSGSMPSVGTSNTTLTLAALVYRTARQIKKDLA